MQRPPRQPRRPPRPLDAARLEELALAYVARFATSAARLAAYCGRKLRERGHVGQDQGAPPPDVAALVARFVASGFVDDEGYARARAGGLLRRGYGARRVSDALRADGIAEPLREEIAPGEAGRREAAAAYARRRRLGPFARAPLGATDRGGYQKQLAALLRAGHDSAHARHVLAAASPGELEDWIAEAREEEDRTA
ncbi:MAG: RecX family transcriptional regulator [Qipengyuania sp.]|jgi:regulatory protein|nr:RecX family transcriptional regulator [Qipengyuania sp.]